MVRYELARRRIEVGERLIQHAPRPVLVRGEGGVQPALSTLILAQLLPQLTRNGGPSNGAGETIRKTSRELVDGEG